MKKQNNTILFTGSFDGGDSHEDDDCPICRLMRENPNPSFEELREAFKEAEKQGAVVGFMDEGEEEEKVDPDEEDGEPKE